MRIHKHIYSIILFFLCIASGATNIPPLETYTYTKEEIIAYGSAQLKKLIAENKTNTALSKEHLNSYIYFTKNSSLPLEKVKEFIWADNYEGKQAQLDELNNKLLEINQGLKAPIYIGVNLDMGRVAATTRIKVYSTIQNLQDIQVESKKQDLLELLKTPVDNLYKEINGAIASSVENPITINAMGFFQILFSEGKENEVFTETWLRQMLVMKHFDKDPIIADKREAVIKQALKKNGIGLRLTGTGDIDLVASGNYLERYKAAINEYWEADLERFVYDYSYSVSNIDQWYQLELAHKETGAFDPKASNKHVYDYTGLFFDFKDNVNLYLSNYTNVDNKPKIVITDDFTDYGRLLEIENILTSVKDAGDVVWIHISKENKVVKQNLYKKGYKLSLDPTLTKRLENFGASIFNGKMSAGKALALLAETDAILTQFGSVVFGGLTDGLNAIKLPREFWDSAAPEYYFKDINEWVKGVPAVEQLVLTLQNDIAFVAGVYNGLIGTLSFITGTAETALKAKAFITKILTEKAFGDLVFEEAQGIVNLLSNEASREAVWLLAKTLVGGEIEKGWDYQWGKIKDNNLTGVYYFTGNIAFEVAIAILSAGVSAEAGVAKEFLTVFKLATEPLEFVVKGGRKVVAPVAKLMKKGFTIATDGAVKMGNQILFKIDIRASKLVLTAQAVVRSMDANFSEVLAIATPEGFIMKMDGTNDTFDNQVLKIIKDTQGNYKVLVEELDALVKLAEDLKRTFGISDINKAKRIAEKLGADKVNKVIQKADVIKTANEDVIKLLDDLADSPDLANNIDGFTNELVESWKLLDDAGRTGLKTNINAIEALNGIRKNTKLEDLKITDDMLSKIEGIPNVSYAQILDDLDIAIKALPEGKVVDFQKVIADGQRGLINKNNVWDRRHSWLTLKKIKENEIFLKNADEIKFEVELEQIDGISNAVPDIIVRKTNVGNQTQISFIGEVKAGDNVITSNFNNQTIRYFQDIDDIRNLRFFRRDGVSLTKQQVIDSWKAGGVLDNDQVFNHFRKFDDEVTQTFSLFDEGQLEIYLKNNSEWFNTMFNSSF